MKKSKLILACLPLAGLFSSCCGLGNEAAVNELRASAYPLVTIDPYTSAWSMSDNLYDSSVKHWTGKDFPFIGAVKVDGEVYRFMGTEDVELLPVVPTSQQGKWIGKWTVDKPSGDWKSLDYNDSSWKEDEGAFGTIVNEPTARTNWTSENIWVRRTFELDEDLTGHNVYLEFCNDDDAFFYVNGVEVHSTGPVCSKNAVVKLPQEAVSTLHKGTNIITATCWNPVANGLLDFGLLIQKELHTSLEQTAVQKYANVQATQTHYGFTCGNVDLDLTFSAPLFLEDLDLVSRPVNYVTYNVTSNDGAAHDVEVYFEASPRWALDVPYQDCSSETVEDGRLVMLKSGSREQNILSRAGDDLRIDWGYFYLAAPKANAVVAVADGDALKRAFVDGTFSSSLGLKGSNDSAKMAMVCDLGTSRKASGHVMVAYDDIYSIQYFGENLRPWWNRNGNSSIIEQLHKAEKDYCRLIDRCYAFDAKMMKDAEKAGGKQYAELCALAYRQSIAAHKLVEAPDGDILWFSKENNSNGSIGTVDITYPSAPMYLYYNTDFAKGMMNHIYYYSESGRWTKPFPAHDVGTYPLANGQTYGGDMPVEESGNMIIITAAACVLDKDASYAAKHWDALTTWTDYLVEYGLDPENQLCTDDFAGHFAHNVNLSAKAIVAIGCYGRMAKMLGKDDVAEKYTAKAREMAAEWVKMAADGDHFRLTFDRPGTWSQKYNLVWDRLLGLGLFPKEVYDKEIAYYLTKQNEYGLPLDSRMAYTKTDWVLWTATLADSQEDFVKFIEPICRFEDETLDRVPMSDWIWTDKPHMRGFKARSVVGGYFIKMLEEKL
ncbi:MAG: DUF4965 domain-containing protein [Clostridium sp.]|nr:DUF4965 domain-containing protein [Bacteroides sp.]MCM1198996.1 DUF4965 domain-containing protein [Clostridium sp.]